MSLATRPHLAPCACPDCQAWAKSIVGAKMVRKPQITPSVIPRGSDMPMADFARDIVAAACRATGLSEEELRRRAEDMKLELPETPVVRPTRDVVAARGVPERHLSAVYDEEPLDCDAMRYVRKVLAGEARILVLSGGVGLRKTGSACWALTQKSGVFVTALQLVEQSYTKSAEDVAGWRRIRAAQVLVIDDLGGEYQDEKGWSKRTVNGIIDYRYSNELDTVITTNLDKDTFRSDYGDRVADRINEVGRFVQLGGASMRRRTG